MTRYHLGRSVPGFKYETKNSLSTESWIWWYKVVAVVGSGTARAVSDTGMVLYSDGAAEALGFRSRVRFAGVSIVVVAGVEGMVESNQ